MKTILISVFLFLTVVGFSQKRQSLFNGKNLKGWTIFVKDPAVNPAQYFYVNDGVIETVGAPAGYLRTKKEYSNYRLHIEWCYPEKLTNSGILIHANGPDKIWVSHYQCQLKHGDAGDFIVHGLGESAKIGDKVYVSTETEKPVVTKVHPSNEKPVGGWNSCDIVCKGNTVEMKINGLLQNVATNCTLNKGAIGLQAEGAKIQFRNLWIERIKDKQAEKQVK